MEVVNNQPLISVIFNYYFTPKELLLKSLNSILNQTYKNIEVLVVNDTGTNYFEKELSQIKDERIRYYRNFKNLGIYQGRNFNVLRAKGKYIAIQDSDDISVPNRLELQLKFLKENNLKICSALKTIVNHTDDKNKNELKFYKNVEKLKYAKELKNEINVKIISYIDFLKYKKYIHNIYYNPTLFMETDVFRENLSQPFGRGCDIIYIFQILRKYEIGVIYEPLVEYHYFGNLNFYSNINAYFGYYLYFIDKPFDLNLYENYVKDILINRSSKISSRFLMRNNFLNLNKINNAYNFLNERIKNYDLYYPIHYKTKEDLYKY